jgi:hypothetical protein
VTLVAADQSAGMIDLSCTFLWGEGGPSRTRLGERQQQLSGAFGVRSYGESVEVLGEDEADGRKAFEAVE